MRLNTINVLGCLAAVTAVAASGLADRLQQQDLSELPAVRITTLRPGSFTHPRPGEFLKVGLPAAAPQVLVEGARPLEIMTYQVSHAEYVECVTAGECEAPDTRAAGDVPVTGVSYLDATAYARWYSKVTGESWRLPTDEEWARAAGERFRADMEPLEGDPLNPARGWLSSYQREVKLARKANPQPRERGAFGANAVGVFDIAGNVWEWTSTCYARTALSAVGEGVDSTVENCGVRVVEGFHRTYMSDFIRDGKSGGCAVGLPPDNLGFRLVRNPSAFGFGGLRQLLRNAWRRQAEV
jgi:formylglycine-generating enzyme required for sulfatase activity